MTNLQIDWNLLRVFQYVLEHKNLTHAARALGLSQPTIGRNIEALEQILGYNLFIRTTKGLIPTKAAIDLLPLVHNMQYNANTFLRVAQSQGHEMKGSVRISASEIVGVEILPKIITNLSEKFTQIDFEIIATDNQSDLQGRDADIAIRMVRPSENQLLIKNIGKLPIGIFAAHEFIEKYGKPNSIEDIINYKIIGFDNFFPYLRNFSDVVNGIKREDFTFRADSSLVQLSFLKAGAGIGFMQIGIGRNNGLAQILENEINLSIDIYVAMHENLKSQKRYINIFRELDNELKKYIQKIKQ